MPLQAQQIVSLACLTAKCPGWISMAGQKLNMILAELCVYDLATNRASFQFVFNPGILDPLNIGSAGCGPYPLPTGWLRANRDDVFYIITGVKYTMVPVELAEWDSLVSQGGLNAYPNIYAVDNSPLATQGAPNMYVWPPPSGSFPVTARYFQQMPDIPTPETSATIPWFPQQLYLERRLAGEMMLMTNDDRAGQFLGGLSQMEDGSSFMGAAAILDRYLKTEGDSQTPKTVTLDKRRFGSNWNQLPNTKTIGW